VRVLFRRAETWTDITRCKRLVAEVYNREYGVFFSEEAYDLTAKIEPWPHRFLMALHGRDLLGTIGLYERNTYVERFGAVTDEDFASLLEDAGCRDRHPSMHKRETTKLSIAHAARGHGLATALLGAAHARAFYADAGMEPPVMVSCGRLSIYQRVYGRAGVATRTVRPFPFYKVHEHYRSDADPMESRLTIPELDVPPAWHELEPPVELDVKREGA